jgi:hypothetical protein
MKVLQSIVVCSKERKKQNQNKAKERWCFFSFFEINKGHLFSSFFYFIHNYAKGERRRVGIRIHQKGGGMTGGGRSSGSGAGGRSSKGNDSNRKESAKLNLERVAREDLGASNSSSSSKSMEGLGEATSMDKGGICLVGRVKMTVGVSPLLRAKPC